jgi:hypothetical protein
MVDAMGRVGFHAESLDILIGGTAKVAPLVATTTFESNQYSL